MDLDKDTIRQVFELGETAVNQTSLAERISNNLQARQLNSPAHWPTFALSAEAATSNPVSLANLREALNNATQAYDKIWLEIAIPASDNSFAARIKRPFHQLVLFYVNRIGQKQIKFNDRLLRVLNHLVALEEQKDEEIKALRQQVANLQERIKELEQSR